jgi:hypothetical protein
MVGVVISDVIDQGVNPRLCETKDYQIGFCSFSGNHGELRRKSKD